MFALAVSEVPAVLAAAGDPAMLAAAGDPAMLAAAGDPAMPVKTVWSLLTGAGMVVVLGTGLLAWWLDRRARRRQATSGRRAVLADLDIDLDEPSTGRPPADDPAGGGEPAAPEGDTAPVVGRAAPVASAANGRGWQPRSVSEAGREYAGLRAAAARAATVAAQARHDRAHAAKLLKAAEEAYEEVRQSQPVEAVAVAGGGVAVDGPGDGSAGPDPVLSEVTARQQYHLALAASETARRAAYVADTALRALAAETAAAAAELVADYDSIAGRRVAWWRPR